MASQGGKAFKNYLGTLNSEAIPSEEDAHAAAIAEVRAMFSSSAQIHGRVSASRIELEKKKVRRLPCGESSSVQDGRRSIRMFGCVCVYECVVLVKWEWYRWENDLIVLPPF
jgi:hypothetical protein